MPTPAPHAHQVKVRDTSTGDVFLAWPVDAREMVRGDRYEYAPEGAPLGAPNAPVEPPVAPPTHAEQLAAKSVKELQALAKKAGVSAKGMPKEDVIAALLPHIAAGTVSLEVLPPIAITAEAFPGAVTE